MKDYERYMNRQKLSETGLAKLVKLEETGGKGVGNRGVSGGKHVPQWVKYCGMAACLAVAFGVFALAILQGGGGVGINPIANASATPAAEELYFNEVVSVPFTDEAIAGGMALNPMEIADVALLFGSSEDDFDGFKEDMGWGKFDMEYYCVDMSGDLSGNKDAFRFLLKGDYVSLQEEAWYSNFYPANHIWLEVYEGHSYLSEEAWQVPVVPYNDTQYCEFIPCQINGHKVIAACDGHDCQAAAVFDVEAGGKTYGVRYTVTSYGEEHGVPNAKELVTRLVRHMTETASITPPLGSKLSFNEMETVPNSVYYPHDLSGRRDVSEDEMDMIFWSSEAREVFGWTGYDYGGSSWPMGQNPDIGWPLYYFSFNGMDSGVDPTCGFNLDMMPNMTDFAAYTAEDIGDWDSLEVSDVNGHQVVAMCGKSYTPNFYCAAAAFVIEDSVCNYGVYYSVDNVDMETAKEMVTKLVEHMTECGVFTEMYDEGPNYTWFLGPYYMELDGEETAFCPRMVFYADGSFQCISDLASSHSCEGSFTVKDGQVVANCERHRFVFDISDENNLRYVGEKSDEMVRYITPKVTDGAVFHRTLDGDGNIMTRDGDTYYVTYSQDGKTPSYDSSKPFTYKFGEEISWKDLPVGEVEPAWNQADKEPVELNGVYYMEADDGDALGNAAKVTIKGGAVTIASERLNYHTCTSKSFARETENGTPLLRVVCDKCKGIYAFEIIDGDTLRFDMNHSAVEGHHSDWTFEVTHGTTFRHLKDGEQTTTLLVWGETTHHEDEHHSSSHH